MARRRGDIGTIDMFRDFTPPEPVAAQLEPELTGGGSLDMKIARAVAFAMAESNKSRGEIAEEMSNYLDQRITENMLDVYASQARRDHKITLERFIALIEVTGCHDLLALVCAPSGYVAVPRQYAAVIRKHQLRDFKERIEREEQAIDAELRGWR